ncbi:dihydroorotate dehydrogenase [Atopobium fossor]|uniref:dihydroorotate dehydrogenase n=1 Tax=Atopobium fossor TaxID=39487 RepID=UPI00041F4B04|nr:dihydroorotate dehydrogenase [Atopobium fossor]
MQSPNPTVDMSVSFAGMPMKNPINTASGTYGQGYQFEAFYPVSSLGAITTKGCSAQPWDGNPSPRMTEITSGIMNSVGLENPGIEAFVKSYGTYLTNLGKKDTRIIVQAAGHTLDEYVEAVEKYEEFAPFADAIELNVSCPNVAAGGAAMGGTPEGACAVMHAVRNRTSKPLIVKMAPVNVGEIARALEDAGADGLSLINTIPGMAINVHTRKSKLSRPCAGISGPAIHNIAVRMVWEAYKACKLPLCGIGGITSGEDAAEFILAGATAVSVGTANLVDPGSALRILSELTQWAVSQGVSNISELIGAFEC